MFWLEKNLLWPSITLLQSVIPWGCPGTPSSKIQGKTAQRMYKKILKTTAFYFSTSLLSLLMLHSIPAVQKNPGQQGPLGEDNPQSPQNIPGRSQREKSVSKNSRAAVLHALIGRQRGRLWVSWFLNISIPIQLVLLWETPSLKPNFYPTYR